MVVDYQVAGPAGWIYDPLTDRWTSMSAPQPPLHCLVGPATVFRAQAGEVVVTGCQDSVGSVVAKLTPETNQWTVLDLPANGPEQPQILWTGKRWIVWGGYRLGPPPPNQCPQPQVGCDPAASMIPTNEGWTLVP